MRWKWNSLHINKLLKIAHFRCHTDYSDNGDSIYKFRDDFSSNFLQYRLSLLSEKTEIIWLDEATISLDNETQLKIQQAIENLQKEYTILIIAHRLSTVRNADRILMLSEGKIIAEGNHSKLIKECKKYRDLYENEIIKEV